jgi:hypothetical protein
MASWPTTGGAELRARTGGHMLYFMLWLLGIPLGIIILLWLLGIGR